MFSSLCNVGWKWQPPSTPLHPLAPPHAHTHTHPSNERMHSRTNDKLLLGTISLGFALPSPPPPHQPSSTYIVARPRNHGSFLTLARFPNIALWTGLLVHFVWTNQDSCDRQKGEAPDRGGGVFGDGDGGAFRCAGVGKGLQIARGNIEGINKTASTRLSNHMYIQNSKTTYYTITTNMYLFN